MELSVVLYNFMLLAFYIVSFTLAFTFYHIKKTPAWFWCTVLFGLWILDDLVIFCIEVSENFYFAYNNVFSVSPTIKTLIYAAEIFTLFCVNRHILQLPKFPTWQFLLSGGLFIYLLLYSLLPENNVRLFFYYAPIYIIIFFPITHALSVIKHHDATSPIHPILLKYRYLLWGELIFSVFTVLEDAYVLLICEDYASISINLKYRNYCEDILSLLVCVCCIVVSLREMRRPSHTDVVTSSDDFSSIPSAKNTKNEGADTQTASTPSERTFLLFSATYGLTTREQDVFRLLLQDKTYAEISEQLYISLGTTKVHCHNIFMKLNVNKQKQLKETYYTFHEQA